MRFTGLLALFLTFPAFCFAQTTWYVPDDFSTIQEAIDGSADGDTVIVRPGTYVEKIDFLGKAITLTSSDGAEATVIDGDTGYDFTSIVTFSNHEQSDSVLAGFTLTNNKSGGSYGGGIECHEASPTIRDNSITGNMAGQGGGGICCRKYASPIITGNWIAGNSLNTYHNYGAGISCLDHSSPTITKNRIMGNFTNNGYGAGISCYDQSHPVIAENTISDNSSQKGGGGIHCYFSCSPVITGNLIMGNTASGGGGIVCSDKCSPVIRSNTISGNMAINGGGIHCYHESAPVIENNLITENSAGSEGGGIYSHAMCSLTLTNNTITGNSAETGGGIYCYFHSTATVTNSILYGNDAATGPELAATGINFPSSITLSHSTVQGGPGVVFLEPGSTLDWGQGMIDADPLFVDPGAGDFHLTYPSPCRDSGDSGAITAPFDLDGNTRISYRHVDMGADEFHPHLYCTGNTTPTGVAEVKFIGIPGTEIDGLIRGFDLLDAPLPCDYGLWYLDDPLWITTGFGKLRHEGVSIIPVTVPAAPAGPYTVYLQGVIDMGLTNLCTVNVD